MMRVQEDCLLLVLSAGAVTVLRYPYPRHVEEHSHYEIVRLHAELGPTIGPADYDQSRLSSSSKEGFLTKRGAIVKNWKERWFTLTKMVLSYYKTRADAIPIRAMDLTDCKECCFNGSFDGHVNCFRVVFPWRVFHLSASTPADAKDWIEIISWKISQVKRPGT